MAIFPRLSIDFVQISLQSTTLSKETKGQGIVEENFIPGQGIIFGNLTPGQGIFLNFLAARPRMFVGQVPPQASENASHSFVNRLMITMAFKFVTGAFLTATSKGFVLKRGLTVFCWSSLNALSFS